MVTIENMKTELNAKFAEHMINVEVCTGPLGGDLRELFQITYQKGWMTGVEHMMPELQRLVRLIETLRDSGRIQ